jgi:DNA-binding winged helix-turn-helix (wHTH) protein/TolB-like protein/Flp pilus assembly protein TadD
MASSIRKSSFYDFGAFRIDTENRLLLNRGEVVTLQPKTFDVLLLLVENRGRVLTKDELMRQIWPDTVVEESNLTQNIYVLRKLFSTDAAGTKYIETIAKRGYRFVAQVSEVRESSSDGVRLTQSARPAGGEGNVISFPHAVVSQEDALPARGVASDAKSEKESDRAHTLAEAETRLRAGMWPSHRTLTKLLLPASVLLILGAAAYLFLPRHASPLKPIQSIAVLPLEALNAGGDDQHLGLGIAEDLTTRLSNTRQLAVRPTSAILRQVSREQDPVAAGRALMVDAVLTGSVQRANDRIRVNAQLLRVADGRPLWAGKFDERVADILTMQDRVSEQLARVLMLELSGEERHVLTRHYTENAEAYELYLKGHDYWKKRTSEGFRTSIEYLQRALEKDSRYALAYAGLAAAYTAQSLFGFSSPKQAMPQAEAMARQALELDPNLAEAHMAVACVRIYYDWNLAQAGSEFERGIELDPNRAESRQLYALYLATVHRFDDARQQLQAARQLDPGSLVIESSAIWIAYLSGKYDDAITLGKQAIESDSGFYLFYQHLGFAYVARHMYEPAIAAFQRARILSANAPASLSRLGHALAGAGKRQEAGQALNELQHNAAPPHLIALVYVGLGQDERALDWLEKAYEEHAADLIYLNTDPIYDSLRGTSRFKVLIQRVGLTS